MGWGWSVSPPGDVWLPRRRPTPSAAPQTSASPTSAGTKAASGRAPFWCPVNDSRCRLSQVTLFEAWAALVVHTVPVTDLTQPRNTEKVIVDTVRATRVRPVLPVGSPPDRING